jgi:hypothetical protein
MKQSEQNYFHGFGKWRLLRLLVILQPVIGIALLFSAWWMLGVGLLVGFTLYVLEEIKTEKDLNQSGKENLEDMNRLRREAEMLKDFLNYFGYINLDRWEDISFQNESKEKGRLRRRAGEILSYAIFSFDWRYIKSLDENLLKMNDFLDDFTRREIDESISALGDPVLEALWNDCTPKDVIDLIYHLEARYVDQRTLRVNTASRYASLGKENLLKSA